MVKTVKMLLKYQYLIIARKHLMSNHNNHQQGKKLIPIFSVFCNNFFCFPLYKIHNETKCEMFGVLCQTIDKRRSFHHNKITYL